MRIHIQFERKFYENHSFHHYKVSLLDLSLPEHHCHLALIRSLNLARTTDNYKWEGEMLFNKFALFSKEKVLSKYKVHAGEV